MSLPMQQLTPDFCVAPQLDPAAMAEAAAAGFKSVINNRPDGEGGPDQPLNADVEAAARAAGLEYRYLPVNGAYQSPEEIAAMRELIDALPKPVLAFCRSGARSTRLFAAASQL
jgi:uncharacterized protein (TIGR01244 family)